MERFGGLVRSLARHSCPNANEADDAVQEIFVDVWRCASRYDATVASETTFIATIARRRLIDRVRRRTRAPRLAAITDLSPVVQTRGRVGHAMETREEGERATAALERLRPEQQQVLRLAIHQGQTHEEIATTTGMPLGTVKTHARRGLIRLRALLETRDAESTDAVTTDSDASADAGLAPLGNRRRR